MQCNFIETIPLWNPLATYAIACRGIYTKGRQKGETGNTSLQIKCVQNWATLNFKGTNNTKLYYKENEVEERLTQTRGEIQHMAGIDMFKNSAQTSTQKWFTNGKKGDTFISWHFNGLPKGDF